MSYNRLKDDLRDVAAGILTPFSEDTQVIRYDELERNVQSLYSDGIELFLACANISEYHSLSHSERVGVTEASVEALPEDACILAGAVGSTKTAIELIEQYESIGVDAIMVMPPDHTYIHEQGLLKYYEHLVSATDLALVPYIRGIDLTVDVLVKLADYEAVAGIKYALEDIIKFSKSVDRCTGDTVWINGLAEPLAPAFYVEGAEGFTAGVSNFEPAVGLALLDALRNGNWDRARELRDSTHPYMDLRNETGQNNTFAGANSIPAVKFGLDLAGLYGGPVRESLVELSEEDKKRARTYHEQLVNAV